MYFSGSSESGASSAGPAHLPAADARTSNFLSPFDALSSASSGRRGSQSSTDVDALTLAQLKASRGSLPREKDYEVSSVSTFDDEREGFDLQVWRFQGQAGIRTVCARFIDLVLVPIFSPTTRLRLLRSGA